MKKRSTNLDYAKWDKLVEDVSDDDEEGMVREKGKGKGGGEEEEELERLTSILKQLQQRQQEQRGSLSQQELNTLARFICVQSSETSEKKKEKKVVQDNVFKHRAIIDFLLREVNSGLFSVDGQQQQLDENAKKKSKNKLSRAEELLVVCLMEGAKSGTEVMDEKSFRMIQEALNTLIACRIHGPAMDLYSAICTPDSESSLALRKDYSGKKFAKEAMMRRIIGVSDEDKDDDGNGSVISRSIPCPKWCRCTIQ